MNSMFDLTGKKALVVGGAGDLGYSMLEALVEAGAEAVCADLSDRIYEVSKNLTDRGYKVTPVKVDISKRDEIKASFEEAIKILGGRIDILVNAAGIQRRHPSEDFPESDWDEVLAVNLTAPWLYSQLAGRMMIAQGKGKIISIASIQSYVGGITIPAYTAAKGGIAQLTKTLSNDWAAKGININAIAPGYMATRLNTAILADEKRTKEIMSRVPQNRWGTGDDMKGITVFLASAASDFVNGTIIPVDGGYLGR